VITIRRLLLVALFFTLIRVVVFHSGHVGPVEWVVSAVLALGLVYALATSPRRA
jgi:hypothetical protein